MQEKENINNDFENSRSENNSLSRRKNVFKDLGRGQKNALIFLTFFSFMFLGGWIINFKNYINDPFKSKLIGGDDIVETNDLENDISDENTHEIDTDSDGLYDWEEKNVYYTSPFLEDTDSDGYTDKEEVDSNNDPNCPKGKKCISTENMESEKKDVDVFNQDNSMPKISNPDLSVSSDYLSPEFLQKFIDGEINTNELRDMMKNSGMDEKLLDQLSDEELKNSYENILKNN